MRWSIIDRTSHVRKALRVKLLTLWSKGVNLDDLYLDSKLAYGFYLQISKRKQVKVVLQDTPQTILCREEMLIWSSSYWTSGYSQNL